MYQEINLSRFWWPPVWVLRRFMLLLLAIACLITTQSKQLAGQADWSAAMQKINPNIGPPFKIDQQLVQAAGIRKLSGKHIDLYTDVPAQQKSDELVRVFDQAIDPWCEYFGVSTGKVKNWKMRAFLIRDPKQTERFRKAGLLPEGTPDFQAGFQSDHNFWLYLQPGDYYTRHLLIHEGTHGFMQWFANGYGAPWYSEGMAEQFGVHRWENDQLTLQFRLTNRRQAEYWGRIKRLKDEHRNGQGMSLTDVINIPPGSFSDVRYYAWSWAGCEFFAKHDKTKSDFEKLKHKAKLDPTIFNQRFNRAINKHFDELERDWELFVEEMEYGYQVERGKLSGAKPIANDSGSGSKFEIQSNKSWQLTKISVQKGDKLRISSTGEFIVNQSPSNSATSDPITWPCQANGITIEYYRGHPLGMLHAGILNLSATEPKSQIARLVDPIPIGYGKQFEAPTDGVLCLRINESPAKMDDNQGTLEVLIEQLK